MVLIDITRVMQSLCSLFNILVSGSLISTSEKNARVFIKATINYNKNIFVERKNVPKTMFSFLSAVSYSLR